jgi:hypothetical protein
MVLAMASTHAPAKASLHGAHQTNVARSTAQVRTSQAPLTGSTHANALTVSSGAAQIYAVKSPATCNTLMVQVMA